MEWGAEMIKYGIRNAEGTERLWTNGKRKFTTVKIDNWVPALFDTVTDAYKKLGKCPVNFRVFGVERGI